MGKFGYKYIRQTQGVNTKRVATHLAAHLLSNDCALTEKIVAALYTNDEMLWLKLHCTREVAEGFITAKLHST